MLLFVKKCTYNVLLIRHETIALGQSAVKLIFCRKTTKNKLISGYYDAWVW